MAITYSKSIRYSLRKVFFSSGIHCFIFEMLSDDEKKPNYQNWFMAPLPTVHSHHLKFVYFIQEAMCREC